MPHTFSIPFSDFSLAFRAQGIILYRLVFDISSKRQRATSGWSLFLIWSTLKIWVVEDKTQLLQCLASLIQSNLQPFDEFSKYNSCGSLEDTQKLHQMLQILDSMSYGQLDST
ncbi:hypothetical protein JHK87_044726 [Glycine soja]|nr:hypothetical protein JHK87_044726 [Glycine soja]